MNTTTPCHQTARPALVHRPTSTRGTHKTFDSPRRRRLSQLGRGLASALTGLCLLAGVASASTILFDDTVSSCTGSNCSSQVCS